MEPEITQGSEVDRSQRRRFVKSEVVIALFAAAPAVDYDRLRRDLDAVVDQDPRPPR